MDVPRAPRRGRTKLAAAIGVSLVGAAALVVQSLPSAAPRVQRAELWTGTVTRAPFVVQVLGAGTLRPEAVRWLTAESSGRVAQVALEAGAEVEPATVVVRLENLDLQLQADHARRDVGDARARALALERQSQTEELSLRGELATLRTALRDAKRSSSAYAAAEGAIVSLLEGKHMQDRVVELEQRNELTERRLSLIEQVAPREIAALRDQVEPLERVQDLRRQMLERLDVRAGDSGQLQEVLVELGQWVLPGTHVAKVMLTRQLHAMLRIPADRAGHVRIGQRAEVRTSLGSTSRIIAGRVRRIAPAANQGTVDVEVELEGELPENARPDQNVDGLIEVERVEATLQLARPSGVTQDGLTELFVVNQDGLARRVKVRIGRYSVDAVEVLSGLAQGQTVILSDMTRYAQADVVKLD